MCDKSMVYRCHGSSPVSGTFDNATIGDHFAQAMKLCNGTLKIEGVQIVANDDADVAIVDFSFERNSEAMGLRATRIWKIREGKFVSWEE